MSGENHDLGSLLQSQSLSHRHISVLGATGSIGKNTMDLINRNLEHFSVRALSAHRNVEELAQHAINCGAEIAVIGEEALYSDLKSLLSGTTVTAAAGPEALTEAASLEVDLTMSALVGAAGLAPTIAALKAGNNIALANKESLVCGGQMVVDLAAQNNAHILPVDSEHNAIFQVFDQSRPEDVSRIILTASGGPFREFIKADMAGITVAQALDHPNWSMGKKITIDSATMMNKGLELIEAYYLFPVDLSQIDVVVHPESVVHSLVEYVDGSTLAQLGTPDMRIPISYALAWPLRLKTPSEKLDLIKVKSLNFEEVDDVRFPALNLARQSLKKGHSAPIILNAANEIAVDAFLSGRINFLQITQLVSDTLEQADKRDLKAKKLDFETIMSLDLEARRLCETLI